MKIKMLKSLPISLDGVKVIHAEKGQELQAPDTIGQMLVDAEFAEEMNTAPAKVEKAKDKEDKDKK